MVDSGPWALLWQEIANGTFDIERLRKLARKVPDDKRAAGYFLKGLASGAKAWDAPTFLLLQAGSYRCKAVGFEADSLASYGNDGTFKLPGVNGDGLRPNASEIVRRVEALIEHCQGLNVLQLDVKQARIWDSSSSGSIGATVYCDPPYQGTTGYAAKGDLLERWKRKGPVWVSEGKPLGPKAYRIQEGRQTNFRKHASEEWITYLEPSEFISGAMSLADNVLATEGL